MNNYDAIIVGAGPSGLMASIQAAKSGARVLVIEKNKKPGVKLSITGGGRCNITNAEFNNKILLKNFGEAEKFLYSPFSIFSVKETFDFFEKKGLPLITEARNRVFPKTQNAEDVLNLLVKEAKKVRVQFKFSTRVKKLKSQDNKITTAITDNGEYTAKAFILATGGLSAPKTGSTGDGFKILKNLGHSVSDPSPNLVPLQTKAKWVHHLAGVTLSFMTARFQQNGKTFLKKTGKILFTHFGVSGPLIINSSPVVLDKLKKSPIRISIDCFPDTEFNDLEKRILRNFNQNKNKQTKNALKDLLPQKLLNVTLSMTAPHFQTKLVNNVTKEERKKFVHILKDLGFEISGGAGFEKAIIADGGVTLKEIDTKHMRSKLFNNLFITGDLLDIRRPSGGYSLQLCWTTGFVAGKNVQKLLKEYE